MRLVVRAALVLVAAAAAAPAVAAVARSPGLLHPRGLDVWIVPTLNADGLATARAAQ